MVNMLRFLRMSSSLVALVGHLAQVGLVLDIHSKGLGLVPLIKMAMGLIVSNNLSSSLHLG